MKNSRVSRRRFLSLLSLIGFAPAITLSKEEELRECHRRFSAGQWKGVAGSGSGSVELEFEPLDKSFDEITVRVSRTPPGLTLADYGMPNTPVGDDQDLLIHIVAFNNEKVKSLTAKIEAEFYADNRVIITRTSFENNVNSSIKAEMSPADIDAIFRADRLILTFYNRENIYASYQLPAPGISLETLERSVLNERKAQAAGECKSVCFITTACCHAVGLQNNCWELRNLRFFRDTWLARKPFGKAEIEKYYHTAPSVLAAIYRSGNSQRQLLKLYWMYILPSSILIQVGFYPLAYSLYRHMMLRLLIHP